MKFQVIRKWSYRNEMGAPKVFFFLVRVGNCTGSEKRRSVVGTWVAAFFSGMPFLAVVAVVVVSPEAAVCTLCTWQVAR